MIGDKAAHRPGFGQLTLLLRQGQSPEQAFTNAFRLPLSLVEEQLRRYHSRSNFASVDLTVTADLTAPRALVFRPLAPVEVCFRLGDELLRIDRPKEAREWFEQGGRLAPQSPLPPEGLGLLEAELDHAEEAVRLLGLALQRGSTSFLAHHMYAAQKFRLASNSPDRYLTLKADEAKEIRSELERALALMPDFAGTHHLLGILELVQNQDIAAAEKHLQRAIQLEPENSAYVFSLAEAQLYKEDIAAARRTLEPLRRPYVPAELRLRAEELLTKIARQTGKSSEKPSAKHRADPVSNQ